MHDVSLGLPRGRTQRPKTYVTYERKTDANVQFLAQNTSDTTAEPNVTTAVLASFGMSHLMSATRSFALHCSTTGMLVPFLYSNLKP